MKPNRWLHLRHPDGFAEQRFEQFVAHCHVFEAYAKALLENWRAIGAGRHDPPEYEFGVAEISADRKVVSLPLGGTSTIGSRATIENASSQLLWRFFQPNFREQL